MKKIMINTYCLACLSILVLLFSACQSTPAVETQKEVMFTTYRTPANQEVNTTPNATEYGYLEGSFSFPSDELPEDLKVVAHNVETGDEISLTYQNEPNFKLKVPAGQYFIYAETELLPEYRAYFTEFVTCGLSVDCPSHKKIIVVVNLNITSHDVNPSDWYNAE